MHEIYFDNFATTRVDDDVAASALQVMCEDYGNPSSLHGKGLAAQMRTDAARAQLADAMGCSQQEILFTSGGTEANNLAVFGAAGALARRGRTLVAMAYEHSSVLAPLQQLEQQGYTLNLVNPDPDGHINIDRLIDAVNEDTVLVSCMLVNSEVGTIAPLEEIVRRIRAKNQLALIHCDAVQALGKQPFSASKLGVDLLSASAHKLHAPKGCGALYIRRGVRILAREVGGGQERGMRAGTENVPAIAAFGFAVEKAMAMMEQNLDNMRKLHEYFVKKAAEMPGLCINSPADATPYLCNFSLPGYRSEILLHYLAQRGIFISSGSACTKGAASHVLRSMGLPAERVDSALRVTFNRYNTVEDVDVFFGVLAQAVKEVLPARRGARKASGRV